MTIKNLKVLLGAGAQIGWMRSRGLPLWQRLAMVSYAVVAIWKKRGRVTWEKEVS